MHDLKRWSQVGDIGKGCYTLILLFFWQCCLHWVFHYCLLQCSRHVTLPNCWLLLFSLQEKKSNKVRVVCIQQGEMKAIECIVEANSSFCKESNNTSHEEYRESPTINTAIYLTFWLSSYENVPTHCMWADIKVATEKKLPEVGYLQLHFLLESGIGKLRNVHLSGSLLIVEQHL